MSLAAAMSPWLRASPRRQETPESDLKLMYRASIPPVSFAMRPTDTAGRDQSPFNIARKHLSARFLREMHVQRQLQLNSGLLHGETRPSCDPHHLAKWALTGLPRCGMACWSRIILTDTPGPDLTSTGQSSSALQLPQASHWCIAQHFREMSDRNPGHSGPRCLRSCRR